MHKASSILMLLISFLVSEAYAQTTNDTVQMIAKKLEHFEFREVISMVDIALSAGNRYSITERIDLLRMKAIAHYSVWELHLADSTFRALLKIDPTFQLDPIKTSPKIISFFNEIKTKFLSENSRTTPALGDTITRDTLQNTPIVKKILVDRSENIYKSLVLPGWGQLSENKKTKGYIFASAGLLAVTSFLYFTFDANKKETMYLNEVNRSLIETRYQDYNHSYKLKNFSLIGLAAVWIAAQIDMFFFPPETESEVNFEISFNSNYSRIFINNGLTAYSVSIRF